ncbi:hypothetical protein Desor_0994 [Desulfosporosinus orientis DSM 765]|uniref:Type 4 fimbrial biogenesis protein PilX N-terminal domain-containing protein n=1 Tax=Desulfosporosinus orientis (strain ATCC 19365 / DSM 765 / NCIMB 8382 / VKM B-1628 / Singapore I) TaxID=768706 RepID=G7W5M2_DESOD|nr:hypothetical protein [Desulfosporosinus orientis]AET66669.1 hypothetical protein Desor_0994 [Desulfosporosinus orientis DSM 765]
MRERGSALLTAVVAIMVLLLISGILFSFIKNQFSLQSGEEKALKAYYLADAGASYGVAYCNDYILNHDEVNERDRIPVPPPESNPFGSKYGGYFEVKELLVSDKYLNSDGTKYVYIITATCDGYFPSKTDSNHILRSIKKDFAFTIDVPPEPPEPPEGP